ncbi:TetR/AcrR family transcriptional regulator [Paenibacillus flagellatus]|uniref:TetR/AcrR family transcriptional regulator n=1 Tax=Paenibacillus flagellatus TaxID=2211139 RepID=A0A2V5KX36_9BACL|nr:TetR/AcrR family transcriptional regulator [Paenibacillus flagellatus]PYI56897.1 TetR/AcrR family transcriptional regulator [Paenibacillus flagellatus]
MPKFNEQEKERIQEALLDKGKELFVQYGLKKTSIDDIVRACGIAKGSFYRFYPSKEELYYAVLKREEAFKERLIADAESSPLPADQLVERLLHAGIKAIEDSPFLQMTMRGDDWESLVRKLPRETVVRHAEEDQELGRRLFERLRREGKLGPIDPDVVTGMLRAVMLMALHRKELGPLHDSILNETIRCIAQGIAAKPSAL